MYAAKHYLFHNNQKHLLAAHVQSTDLKHRLCDDLILTSKFHLRSINEVKDTNKPISIKGFF